MAIKIITDSSCDLPEDILKKFNIAMVPLRVTFESGETYLDRYELSPQEFVAKMRASKALPKTASPDPATIMNSFRKGLVEADEVLFISLSSALSGTFQNAALAKDMLGTDKIEIFDSMSASLGIGIMAIKAAQMDSQGLKLNDIMQRLIEVRNEGVVLFTLDTLDNLVKGGRLKRHEGISGNLLKIKPIMKINDQGMVEVVDKVRGRKKAINRLIEIMARYVVDDFSDNIVGISHVDCLKEAEALAQAVQERYYLKHHVIISEMGSTIATYVGEGGLSVIF